MSEQDVRENLATNIRLLRKAQKLSQEELSEMSGVCRTSLIYVERAKGDICLSTLVRLASALKVEVAELVRPRSMSEHLAAARNR